MGFFNWFGCSFDKQWLLIQFKSLTQEIQKMSTQLDALKANLATLITDVAAEGDAVKAAVMAITGLTDQMAVLNQQLQDAIAANDPAAIQEVADSISAMNDEIVAQTASLSAAIPAVPAPVE